MSRVFELLPDDVPAHWHDGASEALDDEALLELFEAWDSIDPEWWPADAQEEARRAARDRRRAYRPPHLRALDVHGGIVATHELLAVGEDELSIRLLVGLKRIVPLRKGWYSAPDLDAAAALAWRIGGPIACVSALAHHGILRSTDLPADEPLHVAVRSNTSRRPSALTIATYPSARAPSSVGPVRHWSTRDVRSGDRRCVSLEVALEQARHCRPLLARRARDRLSAPSANEDAHGAQPARPDGLNP